jgi:arabinan endo-1,5-alpha-L-arabinosidase
MTPAKSTDLRNWQMVYEGVNPQNPLFENLFDEDEGVFDYVGKFNGKGYAVWAPDVSYNPYLKKYVMYFCVSGSYIKSCICMAVADQPEGPYRYVDTILYSGFDESTVEQTNVREILGEDADLSPYFKKNGGYNNLQWPNCIDPNLFHDSRGRLWMVYGSWSGGIFILEMDEETGYPIHRPTDAAEQMDGYFGKKLLGGGHKSMEGPFVLYNPQTEYYYLFVSFGWLERDGGYQIRLFRSRKPDGPYVDMNGRTLRRVKKHDSYGLKLIGNYIFPGMKYGYKSPGHNSAFTDADGKMYIVYHQRFALSDERHEPRVHQLFLTADNWLTVCPFATEGEMLCRKNYQEAELCGTYYLVEHGSDISGEIHEPLKVEFTMNGEIIRFAKSKTAEKSKTTEKSKTAEEPYGYYEPKDGGNITFSIGETTYEGVVVQLNDEAGNPTMCITGVGENQSVWAVKYLD